MRNASIFAFLCVAYDAGGCQGRSIWVGHTAYGSPNTTICAVAYIPCAESHAQLSVVWPALASPGRTSGRQAVRLISKANGQQAVGRNNNGPGEPFVRLLSGPGMLPHAAPYARASVLLPTMHHAPHTMHHAPRTMQPPTMHRAPICIVHALSFCPIFINQSICAPSSKGSI